MPGDWPLVPLREICERVSVGYVGPTSEHFCGPQRGVPLLRSQNVRPGRLDLADVRYVTREFHEQNLKSHLRPGDVLFVRVGHNRGDTCVVPREMPDVNCANIVFARPRPELSGFVGFFFRSAVGQQALLAITTGSAQPVLNTTSIAAIPVPVPAPRDALAISELLGSLDDKIELNRQMNETLEAMARALFKSWFVDFDPVRAKQEGRAPFGMDADTAALFPDSFEDSELGPIPNGWRVGTLQDVIDIHDSKRIPLSGREREQRRGPYPYYGAAAEMDRVDDYLFEGTHVLLAEDGSVMDNGGYPVLQYVWDKFWVNNHAHVLTGRGVSDEHLLLLLQTINVRPYVTGAVQLKISQRNLCSIDVVVPTAPVCDVFARLVSPLFDKFRSNIEESRTLAELRDTLLPKLISGELRLSEAAELAEAAQ